MLMVLHTSVTYLSKSNQVHFEDNCCIALSQVELMQFFSCSMYIFSVIVFILMIHLCFDDSYKPMKVKKLGSFKVIVVCALKYN